MNRLFEVHICEYCDRIETVHIRGHDTKYFDRETGQEVSKEMWLCPFHEELFNEYMEEQKNIYRSTISY